MSWYTHTENYSIKDDNFYGEPKITYGSSDDAPAGSSDSSTSSSSDSSSSGPWDDFQHVREHISSSGNQHTR